MQRVCGGPFLHVSPRYYGADLFALLDAILRAFGPTDPADNGHGPPGYLSESTEPRSATLEAFLRLERDHPLLHRFIEGRECIFCGRSALICRYGCDVYAGRFSVEEFEERFERVLDLRNCVCRDAENGQITLHFVHDAR